MKAALRGSYVEFVTFMGVTERYPPWFAEEIYDKVLINESNYAFWVYEHERTMDWYEKQLIEDYSVILRKPNGEFFVTDWDVFQDLYETFKYNVFTNSGIAALQEDCIDYVECQGGALSDGYPAWFYEYFTEALNYPEDEKTFFFFDSEKKELKASRECIEVTAGGDVTVTEHCVFLHNKYGEIRGMRYDDFLKYYDPDPQIGED
jgi:hypothetical protein